MKRSTDRILVTHVGSLVRPMSIRNILWAREHGQPYDEAAYRKTLRDEVAGVVRQQAEAGIDIVSDGEYGKAGWIRYVSERLGGFDHRPFRAGDREQNPVYMIREAERFREFYAAYTPDPILRLAAARRIQNRAQQYGVRHPPEPLGLGMRGADHLQGQDAIGQDIDNFKAALTNVNVAGAFMPVAAPMSARGLWLNAYYKSDEEIVVALADALKEEYKAIVDAGFILQLDDAYLAHEYDRLRGLTMDEREAHKYAERCVDLTNYALSGIPEDKVRYHVCWGSWNAPHTTDPPLRTLVRSDPEGEGAGLFAGKRQPAARARMDGVEGCQAAGRQDPHSRHRHPFDQRRRTSRTGGVADQEFRQRRRARERHRRHRLRLLAKLQHRALSSVRAVGQAEARWSRARAWHRRSCGEASACGGDGAFSAIGLP